jgi:hypothetical protein
MIMNEDDQRRYQWLREQFHAHSLHMDGTSYYRMPSSVLKRAKTLDEAIDNAMGVTPTHENLGHMILLKEKK